MRNVFDVIDLRVATLAVRQLAFPDNELQAFLPNVATEDIEYRLESTDRFNKAASVRPFGAPTPIIARPGVVETRGGLPAIGALLPVTESERIRARRLAGTPLADVVGPDATRLAAITARATANKAELFRGQVLSTGMIVINENGVDQVADFKVPAANKIVTPVAWTDTATADMPTDLFTALQAYVDSAGGPPGTMLTSSRVRGLMLRNEAARGLFSPQPSIITPAQLQAQLDAYGLPPIRVNDRMIEDAAGVLQRVIPDNVVIFLPPAGSAALGRTQWGLTETGVLLASTANPFGGGNILTPDSAPGMVTVTLVNDEPIYTAVKTDAIALPVIDNARSIVIMTVA